MAYRLVHYDKWQVRRNQKQRNKKAQRDLKNRTKEAGLEPVESDEEEES